MKIFRIYLVTVIILLGANVCQAKQRNYYFDQDNSFLKGSINYALIGKYKASFQEFEGVLKFDDRNIENSSVNLKVSTASILSSYPRLDRIVKSRRLLDVRKYPYIHFTSRSIKKTDNGYLVEGLVQLHKVSKTLSFIFEFDGPIKDGKERYIDASGQWKVNRKDFDIVWSKTLDRGGIIVGNFITVDWEISAYR